MHTFQMSVQVNENGILSVALPKEWAKQTVNVVLVVEPSVQNIESTLRKEHLKNALDKAVALNMFEGVEGVEWQNEQRQDRILGSGENANW